MHNPPDDAPDAAAPAQRPYTRRRFVRNVALAGTAARLAGTALTDAHADALAAAGQVPAPVPVPVPGGTAAAMHTLDGPVVDLAIDAMAVNFTGRRRRATVVNASLPGPVLRLREGAQAVIRVTNRLDETTSIHWHGLRLPADQDGVPGLSFAGIAPGTTFTYRFPILQSGTYWYHSHSGVQEQTGLSGPLILLPRTPGPYDGLREHILMLTDWTDENPMTVLSHLKQQSDYYNHQQPTLATLLAAARQHGLRAALRERLQWARMRMDPSDIMDVTGATYTFLINGQPPGAGWTGLFTAGEPLRLRVINGASMTPFDLRIPGLPLTVIAADGSRVVPVQVDELHIGVAETYDLIVHPGPRAYTVFAQAEDRSGAARATLAPHPGMSAPVPPLDPRPVRTLADMNMKMDSAAGTGTAATAATAATAVAAAAVAAATTSAPAHDMAGMDMSAMDMSGTAVPGMVMPAKAANGRRTLRYGDLAALQPDTGTAPTRTIEFHLTGNMQRYVWGFDGRQFSQAEPVHIRLGERVRIVLINDTMMEHPIHLHGFLFALENGQQDRLPLKHTVNVGPAEHVSFVFTADTPGHWAFHCHLLYHMESGMFRTIIVA